jgi:LysR family transcriptional regulator, regulator of abg operon
MQLNQIGAFLAVREAGSLRAAARRMGISQPAISKALAVLEQDLGAELFIRTSRGVRLTEAGRLFAVRASVVQSELARVRDDLRMLRGDAEESTAFGIGPGAIALVPPAVARFWAERPHARIRVREGSRVVLLPLVRDGSLDFTIADRGAEELGRGLVFKPMWQPELVIVSRKGHPLAHANSLTHLASASWLLVYRLGGGGLLEEAFSAAGLGMPRMRVHCESHATALALIGASDLLGLIPLADLQTHATAVARLQPLKIRERLGRPQMGAFLRADAPLSPAAARMLQALTMAARVIKRRDYEPHAVPSHPVPL